MTLPVIHLLASSDAAAEILIRKIVKERNASMDEWRELRNLLAQHRSIEYARAWRPTSSSAQRTRCRSFPPAPSVTR
jgi:hypothetical protein